MKTRLNRALQLQTLNLLADCYPKTASVKANLVDAPKDQLEATLRYLEEHGLIERVISRMPTGTSFDLGHRITANGMDFLEGDGGLSAVLGVVTIRLHDDTIKALIAQKIYEADLPQPEKQRFADRLRELPAESTKHLVLKLLDIGLEQSPKAMGWLHTFLGG